MQRLIYVVGGDWEYANWLEGYATLDIYKANLVVFTGGADVSPSLYNRSQHKLTHCDPDRDAYEVAQFKIAKNLGKPMVGVCRGAQFLCAMAGGQLIQDQEDPKAYHPVTIPGGGKITMTSSHHQAMFPWSMPSADYKVLGWTQGVSKHHDAWAPGIEAVYEAPPCNNREVEICYFPKIRALGIQGHPEWMVGKMDLNPAISQSISYCRDLINRLIDKSL